MILSIETATKICAVALHQKGILVAEKTLDIEQAHSSKLTVLIDELLQENGVKPSSLQAIAVSKGPGSYTGLRIGVSVGKGLCFALGIPLIGINTLEALAYQMIDSAIPHISYYCPMIDARRMEVYCIVLDSAGNTVLPTEAKIIEAHAFQEILAHSKMCFFGDGAGKCKDIITHPNALFIENITPKAAEVGKLAYTKFQAHAWEDIAYFEPLYLKDFVNNTKIV